MQLVSPDNRMACYMLIILSIGLFSNAIGHPTDQSEGRNGLVIRITKTGSKCSDSSWILDNSTGFCYTILEQYMTWDEARNACKAKSDFDGGAELAFVRNAQEQQFITTNLLQIRSCPESHLFYYDGCGVWIGLRDTVGDNQNYEWSSKFPVTYTNWLLGEPNTNFERCVGQQTLSSYQWWDAPCDAKRPALCVKKAI